MAGALLEDGSSAVVAERSASGLDLVEYRQQRAPITLDTVAGGQSAAVAIIPAG